MYRKTSASRLQTEVMDSFEAHLEGLQITPSTLFHTKAWENTRVVTKREIRAQALGRLIAI